MTMDKYGVSSGPLLDGLRDEEHRLMLKIMDAQSTMEKKASADIPTLEKQLAAVRGKITELDLGSRNN